MDYKIQIDNLKKIKDKKLYQLKALQKEISDIQTKINKNQKLYDLHNKYSDEAGIILQEYGKKNVQKILKFMLNSFIGGLDSAYAKKYKNINVEKLLDEDEFFDFAIVQIGKPTIDAIKNAFTEIKVIDDEEFMGQTGNCSPAMKKNLGKRLYKKMGKGSVVKKAEELAKNKGYYYGNL